MKFLINLLKYCFLFALILAISGAFIVLSSEISDLRDETKFLQSQSDSLRERIAMIESAPAGATNVKISELTSYSTPLTADVFPIVDTANATTKKVTYGNLLTTLQAVFDPAYEAELDNSAGLRAALSDETGSGGSAVFATGPTLSAPNMTGVTTLVDSVNSGSATSSILTAYQEAKFGSSATSSFSSAGVLTLASALGVSFGGSGQTTANAALNAFLPSQTGNSGKYLTTNGTNSSWDSAVKKYSYTGNPSDASTGAATTTAVVIPSGVIIASSTIVFHFTGTSLYNGSAGTIYLKTSTGVTLAAVGCGAGSNGLTTTCAGQMTMTFTSASAATYAITGLSAYTGGAVSVLSAVSSHAVDFSSGLTIVIVTEALNASNTMNLNGAAITVTP